jgi:hypothetical protein
MVLGEKQLFMCSLALPNHQKRTHQRSANLWLAFRATPLRPRLALTAATDPEARRSRNGNKIGLYRSQLPNYTRSASDEHEARSYLRNEARSPLESLSTVPNFRFIQGERGSRSGAYIKYVSTTDPEDRRSRNGKEEW